MGETVADWVELKPQFWLKVPTDGIKAFSSGFSLWIRPGTLVPVPD
ncbi:hypothetical protein AVEN_82388-1, partial [Araneus ventricosus]